MRDHTHVPRADTRHRRGDDLDPVGVYLEQIGRIPLLTAEQEVELAKRIEAGAYARLLLRDASPDHYPAAATRQELEMVAKDGQAAWDRMVTANLRLVVSIARRHLGQGLPLPDLIQEGNLGLIRAVGKFDYAKGFKFSTYATWWIRQSIERALADQARTVRVPVHVVERWWRLRGVHWDLLLGLGREPTVAELAESAGERVEAVVELRAVSRGTVSLDLPIDEDAETRLSDVVADTFADEAASALEQREFLDAVRCMVEGLAPREAFIVRLRFGLDRGHPSTLQEIADRLGISKERVRQLEERALARLREPEHHQPLLPWRQ